MSRCRFVAWILYVSCVDIRTLDGSFLIPRRVHNRLVRWGVADEPVPLG